MILDVLRVAAEAVALMQDRRMAIGQPRALVEPAACQSAEAVEMWLDVIDQGVRQMNAQKIGKRWIGAIEIQSGRIGSDQVRGVAGLCREHGISFVSCQHLQLLFWFSEPCPML